MDYCIVGNSQLSLDHGVLSFGLQVSTCRCLVGKRLNVLSFGDEAEEDEQLEPDAITVRFRSAHETLQGDTLLENVAIGVHDEHVAQLQERLVSKKVTCPSATSYTDTLESAVSVCPSVKHGPVSLAF